MGAGTVVSGVGRVAIDDATGGGEDQRACTRRRDVEDVDRARDIHLQVVLGVFAGGDDAGLGSAVDDGFQGPEFCSNFPHRRSVLDARLDHDDVEGQIGRRPRGQVIDHYSRVAPRADAVHHVRSDEARTARDEDGGHLDNLPPWRMALGARWLHWYLRVHDMRHVVHRS